MSVSLPARVDLNPAIVDKISETAEEFSSLAAIFHFRGFWPSLSNLHAWISKQWVPLLAVGVQIFPMAKGFFIVKFDCIEDRRAILCGNNFWEDRYPLMAKPWYVDFDPLMESFNRILVWVRILNLPLHL